MGNANQPGAMWAGRSDPFVLVSGHLVSPEDGFGEIGRMANGDLRRPRRLGIGDLGIETLSRIGITSFGGAALLQFRRANGTEASPTDILSADVIGSLNFLGFEGAAFATQARIRARAAENWAPGAHGLALQFNTTSIGSVAGVDRWEMQAAGHLVAATDNVIDLGGIGVSRPRTVNVGTSVLTPLVRVTGDGGMEWTGQADGAGAGAGTLTNAPSAGNPAFWIPVEVNGTTHFIPAWT